MNARLEISVVVPVYNAATSIADAVALLQPAVPRSTLGLRMR